MTFVSLLWVLAIVPLLDFFKKQIRIIRVADIMITLDITTAMIIRIKSDEFDSSVFRVGSRITSGTTTGGITTGSTTGTTSSYWFEGSNPGLGSH
jgi:hypothetical protein